MAEVKTQRNILERLDAGEVLVGDGGMIFALERRGYVKGAEWTPEVCVENPDAVRQLHTDFLHSGSDIVQALTFYASEDMVQLRADSAPIGCDKINRAACRIAREVAGTSGALVSASLTHTSIYKPGENKEKVQQSFRRQTKVFLEEKVDLIFCEFFLHVEEAIWSYEVALETGLPIVCTMGIGPEGDHSGNSPGDCAVKLVQAGIKIIGLNCCFDPSTAIKTIRMMKEALDKAGLKAHLALQPLGFITTGANKSGWFSLPECPFALETRAINRFDVALFTREAYDLGVRYIGGCCGFEPYHIRAISEELAEERGRLPPSSRKHVPWGGACKGSVMKEYQQRVGKEYWANLVPQSGRGPQPNQ